MKEQSEEMMKKIKHQRIFFAFTLAFPRCEQTLRVSIVSFSISFNFFYERDKVVARNVNLISEFIRLGFLKLCSHRQKAKKIKEEQIKEKIPNIPETFLVFTLAFWPSVFRPLELELLWMSTFCCWLVNFNGSEFSKSQHSIYL